MWVIITVLMVVPVGLVGKLLQIESFHGEWNPKPKPSLPGLSVAPASPHRVSFSSTVLFWNSICTLPFTHTIDFSISLLWHLMFHPFKCLPISSHDLKTKTQFHFLYCCLELPNFIFNVFNFVSFPEGKWL